MRSIKRSLLTAFAVCSLLVAVLFFLPAPATACNAVGGGGAVPAFSFTQPLTGYGGQAFLGGGYGTQQFVQADTAYGGCSQALAAPVYAQQFVQPFLGLGLGYANYGLGFRQHEFIGPRRFVVAPRVVVGRQRVVVAGY